MSMTTVAMIILLFGSLAIGMTLVAAYFAAAYKDEKRKNLKKMKGKK
jgi:hypothetical protein